jgi:murein L,D-transpeptidase YcbB/YkuD
MLLVRGGFLALALIGMAALAFGQTPAASADAPDSVPGQAASAETLQAPAETPQNANPAASEAVPRPASKLEELITTRAAQFVDRESEQAAVEASYRERGFQPIWSANGTALPRTRAAIEYLAKVALGGLDPRDYPTPDFLRDMSEETAAANDLKLTASVLKYVRHASAGRVSFTRVSGAILYPPHAADPVQVLAQVSSAQNVGEVLASFEPQHPGFKALQAQLAKELSGAAPPPVIESSKKHDKTDTARPRSDVTDTLIANLERWR